MYRLKKFNVEREVATEADRDRLISKGFLLVSDDILKEDVNELYNLEEMNLKVLKQIAKENNLKDYSKMKKEELIAFLKENL